MSAVPFNPQSYGPRIAPWVDVDRCRPLDGGSGGGATPRLTVEELFEPAEVVDPEAARCCVAAILLLSDQLDASHTWSQQVETPEGSFWHGIMHRREGDYSNAKYWFRRVGRHPVYEPLAIAAASLADAAGGASPLAGSPWDPDAMVDACRQGVRTGSHADLLRRVQQAEWELLFDHSFRLATGR